ncbi:MAG: GGDEF domain-containing protein [Lysobacteraceae bacterium]
MRPFQPTHWEFSNRPQHPKPYQCAVLLLMLIAAAAQAMASEPVLWVETPSGESTPIANSSAVILRAGEPLAAHIDTPTDLRTTCRLVDAEQATSTELDCAHLTLLALPSGRYELQTFSRRDGTAETLTHRWPLQIRADTLWLGHTLWLLAMLCGMGLTVLWMRRRLRRILGDTGALDALVKQRLAQLESTNQRLRTLSETDALTGLANRRHFDEVLRDALARALLVDRPLAVLMLDVDHFKAYNDTYGHLAGDDILRSIGAELRSAIRNDTLAARYGGEEFALIAPAGTREANDLAERLRKRIESQVGVTASIGVACFDVRRDADEAALIARADQALYHAKRTGRNRVHVDGIDGADGPEAAVGELTSPTTDTFEGDACPTPPQPESWPDDELAASLVSATGNSTKDTLASSGSDRTLKPS